LNQSLKETSDRIAHLAAVVPAWPGSSHLEKEPAGSALAQHHTSRRTRAAIGSLAARVLAEHNACMHARELAGSVLAQVRRHEQAPARWVATSPKKNALPKQRIFSKPFRNTSAH
jgi:hypothetical protein